MPLYELHTFTDTEVVKVPKESGVYVLYQVENPILAESAPDLRKALREAETKNPQASHFAIEVLPASALAVRLQDVKADLARVRKSAFMGSSKLPG